MFGIGMQEVLILGVLALAGLVVVTLVVLNASRARSTARSGQAHQRLSPG